MHLQRLLCCARGSPGQALPPRDAQIPIFRVCFFGVGGDQAPSSHGRAPSSSGPRQLGSKKMTKSLEN